MSKMDYVIQPPVFSWNRPIEDIILEHIQSVRRNWQIQEHANIHRSVRKEAKTIIMAYQSVEDFIIREKNLRAKISSTKESESV